MLGPRLLTRTHAPVHTCVRVDTAGAPRNLCTHAPAGTSDSDLGNVLLSRGRENRRALCGRKDRFNGGPHRVWRGPEPLDYLRVGISPPTFSDLDPAGAVSRCQGGISTPTPHMLPSSTRLIHVHPTLDMISQCSRYPLCPSNPTANPLYTPLESSGHDNIAVLLTPPMTARRAREVHYR